MAKGTAYGQFCPVALAAGVVAERWTPLVLRELLAGSVRFNQLQRGLPRMSSALLSRRLKELEFAGIVTREKEGRTWTYQLTPSGRELAPVVEGMGAWAQRWLRHEMVADENLDPDLFMWDLSRSVAPELIPAGRYVVQFEFPNMPAARRRYWLMFADGAAEVCVRDPGHEVALYVTAHLRVLVQISLGHVKLGEVLDSGDLRVDGTPAEVAQFRRWLPLSPFAVAA